MVTIAVVNYGVGNVRSVKRALEKIDAIPLITLKAEDLINADAIILPGVGSFKSAMEGLKPVLQSLYEAVKSGKPILGICLGLQLYFEWSEEGGGIGGLGLIEGYVDLSLIHI